MLIVEVAKPFFNVVSKNFKHLIEHLSHHWRLRVYKINTLSKHLKL